MCSRLTYLYTYHLISPFSVDYLNSTHGLQYASVGDFIGYDSPDMLSEIYTESGNDCGSTRVGDTESDCNAELLGSFHSAN